MSHTRTADQVFAAALLALGAYIIRNALAYGYMRDALPGPGFFPLWIGLGLIALSAVNLVRSVRGHEVLASRFDGPTVVKTLAITVIVLLFVITSPWLGMLVAIGIAIGLGLLLAASRTFTALLFVTSPRDPLVIGTVVSLIAIVTLAAAAAPSIRARRINPIEALRLE